MRHLTLGEVVELHPTLVDKAAALVLNGYEIQASVDDQEHLMLAVASGALDRQQLVSWLNQHIAKIQ